MKEKSLIIFGTGQQSDIITFYLNKMSRKIYDLTRLRKTYPLRRKRPVFASLDDSQMESVIIDIQNNEALPYTYTFTNVYVEVPVCVASIENSNMNVFITSVTNLAVTLNVSGLIPDGDNIKIQLQIFTNKS